MNGTNMKIKINKQIENIKFYQNFIFIYFFESISKVIFRIEHSIKMEFCENFVTKKFVDNFK